MNDIPPNLTTIIVAVLSSAIVTQWIPSIVAVIKENLTGKKRVTLEELKAEVKSKNEKMDKIGDGVKFILQDRLQTLCEHYIATGWIRSDELKKVINLYHAYHALGGNDFITELFEKVNDLPLRKG